MARRKTEFDRAPNIEEFEQLKSLKKGARCKWRKIEGNDMPPFGTWEEDVVVIKTQRDVSCADDWGVYVVGREDDTIALTWLKFSKESNIMKLLKQVDAL